MINLNLNLGVDVSYIEGVRVEIISDWVINMNSGLRVQLWSGGGAMAVRMEKPLNDPNSTRQDIFIAIAKQLREALTDEQFNAILEHELAHIRNGDLDNTNLKKVNKTVINHDCELAADKAAVEKYGAKALYEALQIATTLQINNFVRVKNEKAVKVLKFLFTPMSMRKRLKMLSMAM